MGGARASTAREKLLKKAKNVTDIVNRTKSSRVMTKAQQKFIHFKESCMPNVRSRIRTSSGREKFLRKKQELAAALNALKGATPNFELKKGTHTKKHDGKLFVEYDIVQLYIRYHGETYNVIERDNAVASVGEWGAKISMHLRDNGGPKKILKFQTQDARDAFLKTIRTYQATLAAYKRKVAKIKSPTSKKRRRLVRLSQCNVTEPTPRRKHT